MAIKIGNKSLDTIYLGTQRVSQVYLGSKLIWPENKKLTINQSDIDYYCVHYITPTGTTGYYTFDKGNGGTNEEVYAIPYGSKVWIQDIVSSIDSAYSEICTDQVEWESFTEDTTTSLWAVWLNLSLHITSTGSSALSKVTVTYKTAWEEPTSTDVAFGDYISIPAGSKVWIDAGELNIDYHYWDISEAGSTNNDWSWTDGDDYYCADLKYNDELCFDITDYEEQYQEVYLDGNDLDSSDAATCIITYRYDDKEYTETFSNSVSVPCGATILSVGISSDSYNAVEYLDIEDTRYSGQYFNLDVAGFYGMTGLEVYVSSDICIKYAAYNSQ